MPAGATSAYFFWMLAKALVGFYGVVHGRMGLPGAGWLIRTCRPFVRGLWHYPLAVPGVGTTILDFRDDAAFGMLNRSLGETAGDAHLFRGIDLVLEDDGVLWDVGANVGYFSLYFARRPKGLRALHAFEPNPVALGPLTSLFQNHPWVKIHPVGLGRRDEKLEMDYYAGSTPYSSLARTLPNAQKVSIQVRNGDAYCKENRLDLPTVIKVDVEGFEVEVIAGLRETITKSRPVIFFEHGWLKDDQIATIRSLVPGDYQIGFLFKNGQLTDDPTRRGEGDDAVLVPPEKNGRLKELRMSLGQQ